MIENGKEVEIQEGSDENLEFLREAESEMVDVDLNHKKKPTLNEEVDVRENVESLNEGEENKIQLV